MTLDDNIMMFVSNIQGVFLNKTNLLPFFGLLAMILTGVAILV